MNEPTVRLRIHLPVTLAAKAELLLRDTARPGKRIYGGLSRLVTSLLTDYFNRLEQAQAQSAQLARHPAKDSLDD